MWLSTNVPNNNTLINLNMEADSTTYEHNSKSLSDEPTLPFSTCPGNFQLYKDFVTDIGDRILEGQIVERLQNFGLLRSSVKCLSGKPDCTVTCKNARVVDRVQWVCNGCGKRQAVRDGSFFFRIQCSILQTLQIMLAWCEDAELSAAAEHFGVKLKVASHIYDRLDELAVQEYNKHKLGGENSVVLAEMYPDCTNRLSPDTTDLPHVHRILMLADTNHIPTYYRFHLIEDNKQGSVTDGDQVLKSQIEDVISQSTVPGSTVVTGHHMPPVDGASSIQHLTQQCDVEMEHFLSSRIWRQAITLCAASRDFCPGGGALHCGTSAQRYLRTAAYRLRYGDGFYRHMLEIVAREFTVRPRDVADQG